MRAIGPESVDKQQVEEFLRVLRLAAYDGEGLTRPSLPSLADDARSHRTLGAELLRSKAKQFVRPHQTGLWPIWGPVTARNLVSCMAGCHLFCHDCAFGSI
eukprot:scaffold224977_cov18-Prasinocladus_malaysianus.AAC.1